MDKNYKTSVDGSVLQARGLHKIETTQQDFNINILPHIRLVKPQFHYGTTKVYGDSTIRTEYEDLINDEK